VTGKLESYSEQQYLDCAFDFGGAQACVGAPLNAYMVWSVQEKKLSGSTQYPYTAAQGTCKADRQFLNLGASLTSTALGFNVSEKALKNAVRKHGAVGTVLVFDENAFLAFRDYKSGIFNSCSSNGTIVGGLAITVVGFGTEGKQDYWLIKNSWSTLWGDKGYMKLRRGVKACSIGIEVAVVRCRKNKKTSGVGGFKDCEEGDDSCEERDEGEENEAEDGDEDEGENDEE
jgi:hypothetical protein